MPISLTSKKYGIRDYRGGGRSSAQGDRHAGSCRFHRQEISRAEAEGISSSSVI